VLRLFYNLILIWKTQPTGWNKNRTILLPKQGKGPKNIGNYRPNTIGSILGRVYWGNIDNRLRGLTSFSNRQKGFVVESGYYNNMCHIWQTPFIKPYCKCIRIMSKYWKQSVLPHTRKRILTNLTTSWPVFSSKLKWAMSDTLSISKDWTTSSCEALTSTWHMGPNVRIRFSTNNLSRPHPSQLKDHHTTPLWPLYIR